MGRIQANFEQRASKAVNWDNSSSENLRSNMHVDADKGFDYKSEKITPQVNNNNSPEIKNN
jgi:hypothetical protein